MHVGPLEVTVEDYQQISKEIFNKVNLGFSESQTRWQFIGKMCMPYPPYMVLRRVKQVGEMAMISTSP